MAGRPRPDRRKHKRFKVKGVAHAVIKSESKEDMGQLLDISKGGLSLHYYMGPERVKDPHKLDIIYKDHFELNNVPCKEISNFEITSPSPQNFLKEGRYGLQFKNLTAHQTSKLEYFIQNYTRGEA
jgi:hypothetical protein